MRTKKMIYGGLLTAVGLVLPQAFHVFGQGVGMAFLPMHLPVMIAGILLGPCYGGLIGLIVPLVSSMLTGMPPVPKLYFMLVELVAYGIFTGIFIRKMNVTKNKVHILLTVADLPLYKISTLRFTFFCLLKNRV